MSKGFVSFQFCFPIILLQKTFNYKSSFSGCKKIILRILCNTIQLLISVSNSLKIRLIIFSYFIERFQQETCRWTECLSVWIFQKTECKHYHPWPLLDTMNRLHGRVSQYQYSHCITKLGD